MQGPQRIRRHNHYVGITTDIEGKISRGFWLDRLRMGRRRRPRERLWVPAQPQINWRDLDFHYRLTTGSSTVHDSDPSGMNTRCTRIPTSTLR